MSKVTGAGIICYYDNRDMSIKKYSNEIIYLFLIDNENMYDFPKGGIDKGESYIQCAKRETYEESNIESIDFEFLGERYLKCSETLCMFLGELKKEVVESKNIIKIKKNPKTKIREHKSFIFETKNNALEKNKVPSYLIPYLEKAESIILS